MDAFTRLELLATQMDLEPAEEAGLQPATSTRPTTATGLLPCGEPVAPHKQEARKRALGIHQAVMPSGKRISLLKTLLTSACERDCAYCPFRARRNYRRVTFRPEEMARAFIDMHRAGAVQGLFLSSGIAGGGLRTQDRLIDTAEILRRKYGFRGYLHLKIMPGAEQAQVERVMQLADRVSINLEAPNPSRLQRLAPGKNFLAELFRPLEWVEAIRRADPARQSWNGRWPSSVTQFVVGAAGESDVEILTAAGHLYRHLGLARAYFSAFRPIPDTPLENQPAENPLRQHRLYQSSYLLRDYGFDLEELPFAAGGNLPLDADPKLAWARAHLSQAPVEINHAGREELLRVPGIGPKGVEAIVAARRSGTLRELGELQALGINASVAAPFVQLDGRRPPRQLSLW